MSRAASPTLLTASWVPVASPPIPEGCAAVRDGRILGVGMRGDPALPPGGLRDPLSFLVSGEAQARSVFA